WHGIGGYPGGAVLLLFGLAALAPACHAAWVFSRTLATHWPRIRRFRWTWIGGGVAFLLIASSWATRLESIYYGMGLVFAPAVGAMAGDWARQRGTWAGPRDGLNLAGIIAWTAGIGVRAGMDVARIPLEWDAYGLLSSPVLGFVTAWIV